MKIDLDHCAELLKAIAHPVRLRVLHELKNGKKCVMEIKDLIDISQPNLSQHLAILRREKIIDYEEEGKKRCYFINDEVADLLLDLITNCTKSKINKN
jgi:ArsR family transcriptional regulator